MEEEMELIERYLHEVGRSLPKKNREDILAEIRSDLEDRLEERSQGNAKEEDVVALLQEYGSPQKVAASYAPDGQYLIGPALYPLWRMVTGIVLAATIGAQLLAWGIALWAGNGEVNAAELIGGLFSGALSSIGSTLIVFMILQRAGVQPKLEEKWDPRNLPVIVNEDEVKRGELIFGIAGGSILLALLVALSDRIGVYSGFSGQFVVGVSDGFGGQFYPNPVIQQLLPWIYLSLAVSIGFDIYLLWRGRWETITRGFELGVDFLSIAVLTMLYKGHAAWLTAHGSSGVFFNLTDMFADITTDIQVFGMKAFCLSFGIALIVVVSVTISKIVKMIIRSIKSAR